MQRKVRAFIVLGFVGLLVFFCKKTYDMIANPVNYLKDCLSVNYFNEDLHARTSFSFTGVIQGLFKFIQIGGTINDASCVNNTSVLGIIKVESTEDIKKAFVMAKENNLKVSIAGERHSMGGQTFCKECLVLDTRSFNKVIFFDNKNHTITVQPGVTWRNIQELVDVYGLSVSAMQSINMFTVGGSIAVNAHGISHNPGSIASSITSMKVMLSSGEVVETSLEKNRELFSSVIGGYGLYGVITEVTLKLVPNELYVLQRKYMNIHDFPDYYKNSIKDNRMLGLLYGRVSIAPFSGFKELYINEYTKVAHSEPVVGLQAQKNIALMRFIINFSKKGSFGKSIRRGLEKYLEPRIRSCDVPTRNNLMSQQEDCIVVRNQEMYDTMYYLKNRLKDTDILQEYFIPIIKLPEFIKEIEYISKQNNNNLLNITMRFGIKDTISHLPYFNDDDMLALVLYFNHNLSSEQMNNLEKATKELIDAAINLGGTYYLPYQLYYSKEQLEAVYPNITDFFEKKKVYDPSELLVNKFYLKYK